MHLFYQDLATIIQEALLNQPFFHIGICGDYLSGKTILAQELKKKLDGEIVNIDQLPDDEATLSQDIFNRSYLKSVIITEGLHSMDEMLRDHYDLTILLKITPELQKARAMIDEIPTADFHKGKALAERSQGLNLPEDQYDIVIETL